MQLRIRFLLPLLLLFPCTSVEGQEYAVDRGSVLVGGSASFTNTGSDDSDERNSRLLLQPRAQYFVAKGLAIGGSVTLSRYADDDDSSTTVGIGPEISYYFGAAQRQRAYPFVSGNLQWYEGEDTETFGFGGSVGLLYMLAEAVGLETAVFYRDLDYGEFGGIDEFGIGVGISAFVF